MRPPCAIRPAGSRPRTPRRRPDPPTLTTVAGWKLFTAGMANSLILVLGALAAPLAGALWRAAAWLVVVTRQSSPVVLALVVAATIRQAIFGYAPAAAPEPLSALIEIGRAHV